MALSPDNLIDTPDGSPIVLSLLAVAKLSRSLLALKLSELGLFNGQDELLLALSADAPRSVSSLSDAISVRPSTVSKMVDRLMEYGLLTRERGTDKRATLIAMTEAGMQKRALVVVAHKELEAALIKYSSHDSVADMAGTLERTEGTLRRIVTRLR